MLSPVREQPCDGVRTVRERRDLEHAQRAVPEHRLDVGQRLDHQILACLPEVDDVPRRRDLLGLERLVFGAACDLLGDDDIDRQDDAHAVLLGGREDPLRVLHAVRFGQALADGLALGQQEGVRHAAAQDEHVDPGQQVIDDLDLVADLGPTKDRSERPLRRLHQLG